MATPGRLIDLMERGHVDFSDLQVVVFDETDEMLKIGFQRDIEYILDSINSLNSDQKLQYLLFSATVPVWVQSVARKFMNSEYTYINMVQKHLNQTAQTIEHLKIKCKNSLDKINFLKDLITVNIGQSGRAIIFINSKSRSNIFLC